VVDSFLIALREGLEAALIVGIVLVSLGRSGRSHLVRFVWAGAGLAVALSFVAAVALDEWKINQEAFEGVLLLSSAVFVVTVIVWMGRAARNLRRTIETRVETYASRSELGAGMGLGIFVFLMVLREGAELALILRAVELSSRGVVVWTGTLMGLAAAVTVGVLFFKGTLKISLGRFFAVTSWILVIVAVQLALTGVHELSEGGWLPAGPTEMAILGPVVRNEVFFFAAILGVAALLVLREWLALPKGSESSAATEAERQRLAAERKKQARWLLAAGATFVAVILILTANFLYARTAAAAPDAQTLQVIGGEVRVPTAGIGDGNVHFYQAQVDGSMLGFMVVHQPDGQWVAAIEGCMICGRHGYRQEGTSVICRNCGAEIPISTLGQVGGCNPVAMPARVQGGNLVIASADLGRSVQVSQ
jgi:high-affinity iron transporter